MCCSHVFFHSYLIPATPPLCLSVTLGSRVRAHTTLKSSLLDQTLFFHPAGDHDEGRRNILAPSALRPTLTLRCPAADTEQNNSFAVSEVTVLLVTFWTVLQLHVSNTKKPTVWYSEFWSTGGCWTRIKGLNYEGQLIFWLSPDRLNRNVFFRSFN